MGIKKTSGMREEKRKRVEVVTVSDLLRSSRRIEEEERERERKKKVVE